MPPKKKSKKSSRGFRPIKVVKVGLPKDDVQSVSKVSTKPLSSYWMTCFKSVTFDPSRISVIQNPDNQVDLRPNQFIFYPILSNLQSLHSNIQVRDIIIRQCKSTWTTSQFSAQLAHDRQRTFDGPVPPPPRNTDYFDNGQYFRAYCEWYEKYGLIKSVNIPSVVDNTKQPIDPIMGTNLGIQNVNGPGRNPVINPDNVDDYVVDLNTEAQQDLTGTTAGVLAGTAVGAFDQQQVTLNGLRRLVGNVTARDISSRGNLVQSSLGALQDLQNTIRHSQLLQYSQVNPEVFNNMVSSINQDMNQFLAYEWVLLICPTEALSGFTFNYANLNVTEQEQAEGQFILNLFQPSTNVISVQNQVIDCGINKSSFDHRININRSFTLRPGEILFYGIRISSSFFPSSISQFNVDLFDNGKFTINDIISFDQKINT